jgi:uncharacterized protein
MKSLIIICFIIANMSTNLLLAQDSLHKIKDMVPNKVTSIDLPEVKLLDGPFKKAMELDAKYLLELNPDRLLSWFRKEAGLKPKGEVYGGWESDQLAGHTLGHYLSACSMMYASTENSRLLDRVNYIIDELDTCQTANGNGYVAAIPGGKQLFKEISEKNIIANKTSGFRLNGIWSPWYTIHKLFAGLLDAQKYCGNQKALEIAKKLGDWAYNTTKNLTPPEFQHMLVCEYGGMNEAMAELYSRTGDRKYLELAGKFFDDKVLVPLENQEDNLNGLHSNTQIPKIIGLVRLYKLTGNTKYLDAAKFFWKIVVKHHSYVIGGNSENEYFGKPDDLSASLDSNTCETCNTYNMLKLTRKLFELDPKQEYAEFYERALYNHILASQNPVTGMMCYFMPLEPGAYKDYSTPFNSFWCCVGTGMENHSKYGRNIYYYNNDSLIVNLFIASKADWTEKGISIVQQTEFPNSGKVKFIIDCRKPVEFSFLIRQPQWSGKRFNVLINDKKVKDINILDGYARINRTWNDKDIVEINLSMSLDLARMTDDTNKAAIMYGPLVLAGELGPLNDSEIDNVDYVPVFVPNGKRLNEWIKPVKNEVNTFQTFYAGHPRNVTLIPFYKVYDGRYSVYWDILTAPEWKIRSAEIKEEKEKIRGLEKSSFDYVHPGITTQEMKHNYKGENTGTGEEDHTTWRAATSGGWMSYDLKVSSDYPVKLVCRYWGGIQKERNFDIYIDGQKIASQKLYNDKPGRFFYVYYLLDPKLTNGEKEITVKFQSHKDDIAGGVFGIWTVNGNKM